MMVALGLEPDAAETEKQQLAISRVFEELRQERMLTTYSDIDAAWERVKELEATSQRRERYVRELAGQVRTFRQALLGGGFPPPWWVTATHALDEMERLTAGEEEL
jgi:hypothetical protein